jgi:hypothetical protein
VEEAIPSKSVSAQQLQGNCENARKSTGPRTAQGKCISSRNVIKHGLLSKELVIRSGEGRESAKEFQHLLSQLQEDLQPSGRAEESFVDHSGVRLEISASASRRGWRNH